MSGCQEKDKETITPKYWLKQFMEKGIDCVAVTDHNSGEWIDQLKEQLTELEENPPDWFRPLFLFPGVEISVHGGIHILAIFNCSKRTSDIDSLLGAVGYHGTKGNSDKVTNQTATNVVNTIVSDKIGGGHAAKPFRIASHFGFVSSELTIEEKIGKAAGRKYFLERRGEGVKIILDESERLSGKMPVYEMFGEELRLTLFAAKSLQEER